MTYLMFGILLWLILGLLAPSIGGDHAEHNALYITKPKGPLNPDGSVTAFAHLQEKGEYRLCKLIGICFALICGFIIYSAGSSLTSQVIPPLLGMAITDSFSRKIGFIDFAGHAAEILEAERWGVPCYRKEEIERMSDDPDKKGKNIPKGLGKARHLARVVWALGKIPNLHLGK